MSASQPTLRLAARDVFSMALLALRGNWLRSALTALGVIIGIAAVIVMVAVGNGTRAELDRVIEGLGANRIDITPNLSRLGSAVSSASSLFTLTQADAKTLRERIPEIAAISGTLQGRTAVVNAELNWVTQWQGIERDYFELANWRLAEGEWPTPEAYESVLPHAVIGETVRQKLFGEDDPSGRPLRVGNTEFLITGVLERKGLGAGGNDQDDVLFVPLETARRRLLGRLGLPPQTLMSITLNVSRPEDLAFVEQEATSVLRESHRIALGASDDFVIRNLSQLVSARSETTHLMSVLLAVVAGISLLVGGIGIMNIMLVSVTERTREIGLRLAIGANAHDIRQQFLAEATLLSLGGGVVGIAFGVLITELTARFGSLPVVLNVQVIAIAALFSIGTGLFFGYYPARRASMLDPIEALRHG